MTLGVSHVHIYLHRLFVSMSSEGSQKIPSIADIQHIKNNKNENICISHYYYLFHFLQLMSYVFRKNNNNNICVCNGFCQIITRSSKIEQALSLSKFICMYIFITINTDFCLQ